MTLTAEDIAAMYRHPDRFRDVVYVPAPGGPQPLNDIAALFQLRDFRKLDRMFKALRDQKIPQPRYAWIERTKGSSKTSDITIELIWAALFVQRMLLIQCAASDEEQAQEIEKVVRAVLKLPQNKWIADRLKPTKRKIENPQTGTTIEILAADELGTHGARPDILLVDEVSHAKVWPFVETLQDNLTKMPASIGIFGTNAGLTNSPAYKLRELARTSPLWVFSSYTEPAPWLNQDEIAERRRVTTASRYKRLWGGIWTTEASDGIDPDLIHDRITLNGPHYLPLDDHIYCVGVDTAVRKDLCAACTLAVDTAGKQIKLAEVRTWAPSKHGGEIDLDGVESYLRDLHRRFNPAACWIDPSHFWSNIQRMKSCGFNVEARPVTSNMLESFATALLSVFNSKLIQLFDCPLIADIAHLEIEDMGARWRVKAERNSAGHADLGFAFCMALPPAIEFLKFGNYTPPSHGQKPPSKAAASVHMGQRNAPGESDRIAPLQRRFGLQLAAASQGYEVWHRRPAQGFRRIASCIQFSRTR
jgi:hypothetical protein